MENDTIKVYGTRWCGDCLRAKRFLDRNKITHQWINIDLNRSAKNLVRQLNNGQVIVPTIIFPDGSILREPSNSELREKLGLDKAAKKNE
jgi:glutaredoxin-like protein